MNYQARKAGSLALGILSAAGTVMTAILVAKETPKAIEKIKKIKAKKEKPTKMEYIKALAPIYWPAGVICLGTIASTTISQVISMRTQASLIATSTMLSQGWRRYKGKVKDVLGIDGDRYVTDEIALDEYEKNKNLNSSSDNILFWEEHLGFFSCKKEDLLAGIADLNQRLHTQDSNPLNTSYWTNLYFLIEDANAKIYDKNRLEACKNIGWTLEYLREIYGLECMWVHPLYTRIIKKETGEVLFIKIDFFEDPIFFDANECSRFNNKSLENYLHEAELDMHDADAYDLYLHGCYSDEYEDSNEIKSLHSLSSLEQDENIELDEYACFHSTKLVPVNKYLEDCKNVPSEEDIPDINDIK